MSVTPNELTKGHVLANVTWLIDELLSHDETIMLDSSRVDATTYHECPNCGIMLDLEDRETSLFLLEGKGTDNPPTDDDFECICPSCGHMFNEEDAERATPSVMEWYIVSEWLGGKLYHEGEIVLDKVVWGRQATGQGVHMDAVIKTIAANLG